MGTEWASVYPCDLMVHQELQLSATSQHHERIVQGISLAQENIKIQNLKHSFY